MKRVKEAVGIEVDRNKMVKEKMGLQIHSVHTVHLLAKEIEKYIYIFGEIYT